MNDRITELQNHAREVSEDRDQILEEKRLLTKVLTKASVWVRDHARHTKECPGEGKCTCGLDEVKRDLT
jgi:hypothetical protein